MATLLVMRHGKSDWSAGRPDHERPLKGRGVRAARAVGRWLRDTDQVPAVAVASTARRAADTLHEAADAGGWTTDLRSDDDLYHADVSTMLAVAARAGRDGAPVLLVGHEPTCSGLVGALTGARARFVTAAVASVELGGRWGDLDVDLALLHWFVTPHVLPQASGG